jgi:hypothetical protein
MNPEILVMFYIWKEMTRNKSGNSCDVLLRLEDVAGSHPGTLQVVLTGCCR